MARLAATTHGADWVINADADEFWWPHNGTSRQYSPPRRLGTGVVRGIWRHFVLRPEEPVPFYDRMVVRRAPALDPVDPYCANAKVAHRADPNVRVGRGNHDAFGERLSLLRERVPLEILHFPIRSLHHLMTKYPTELAGHRSAGPAFVPPHIARVAEACKRNPDQPHRSLLVNDEAVERGSAGMVVRRHAFARSLRGDTVTPPTIPGRRCVRRGDRRHADAGLGLSPTGGVDLFGAAPSRPSRRNGAGSIDPVTRPCRQRGRRAETRGDPWVGAPSTELATPSRSALTV